MVKRREIGKVIKPEGTPEAPLTRNQLRVKSIEELRILATDKANEYVLTRTGESKTRIEILLEDWSSSSDPMKQRLFVEYAYGKVPDEVQGNSSKPIRIIVEHVERIIEDTAPETVPSTK